MKKVCVILGCLFLAVGLALSSLGTRLGGDTSATVNLFGRSWSVGVPFSSGSVSRAYDEASPTAPVAQLDAGQFSSIYVDLDMGSVSIIGADSYGISVDYQGGDHAAEYYVDSYGVLYIENSDDGIEALAHSHVTVYVPAGTVLDVIDAELDLGDLTLSGLSVGDLFVDLDLGSVTGEGLTVRDMVDVKANLGSVALFGDLGQCVYVDADLGDVTLGLSRPAEDCCWSLSAGLGGITVDGKSQGGTRDVEGGHGDHFLNVEVDSGSINVDFGLTFGTAVQGITDALASDSAVIPEVSAVEEVTPITNGPVTEQSN